MAAAILPLPDLLQYLLDLLFQLLNNLLQLLHELLDETGKRVSAGTPIIVVAVAPKTIVSSRWLHLP
jgi:hypothetical protein